MKAACAVTWFYASDFFVNSKFHNVSLLQTFSMKADHSFVHEALHSTYLLCPLHGLQQSVERKLKVVLFTIGLCVIVP